MHRPARPRLRTLSLTLALGVLVALFGASAAHATDPEACADPPADEVSSSRVTLDDGTTRQDYLVLFDVYWNDSTDEDDPNSKTLINNPCPPLVIHSTRTDPVSGGTITTTTRAASDVDIGHTIIHIPSAELQQAAKAGPPAVDAVVSFKRRVTASGTGDYDGADYAFLRPLQDDGTRAASADVWVVPACEEGETPTRNDALDPPFCLGFSAGLLNPGHWNGDVQYEVQAVRQPGHATGDGWGDFFVFHVENGTPNVIWRTDAADTNVYPITPGTYDHAFWAFTKPGTYQIQVQAKGRPNSAPSVGDPLISATTVTSLVRTYTFHVGDLTLVEPPQFQVERSVRENAAAGTNVGEPIAVAVADDSNTLDYWLTGEGSLPFDVTSVADGAQITVATGASLDYETTPTYDLTLNVSDDLGRTGYIDLAADHTLGVHIALEDENETPSVVLSANTTTPVVGNTLTLTATVSNSPVASEDLRYTWYNVLPRKRPFTNTTPPTVGIVSTFSGERRYSVRAWYTATDGTVVGWDSNEIAVTWSN